MKKNIKQLPLYMQMKNTSKEMQKAEASLQYMQLGQLAHCCHGARCGSGRAVTKRQTPSGLKSPEANKAPGSSLPNLLYLDGGLLTLGNSLVQFEAGSDLK